MPNWFPSWTNCSQPQSYHSIPSWATALIIASGGFAVLIAASTNVSALVGSSALWATLCLAGIAICDWWLNIRLICLGGDRSAVGAIHNVLPPDVSGNPADFGSYDTDYSFNLLLWPFTPGVSLPANFVGDDTTGQFNPQEWDPVNVNDHLWSDAGYWTSLPDFGNIAEFSEPPSGQPAQVVKDQVNLILPQQSMASLQMPFTGQDSSDAQENPHIVPVGGSDQQFLLHCEIEGRGVYDLRRLLQALFALFTIATILYLIPGIGTILAWILSLLAFLAFLFGGNAIQQNDKASPPGGDWGGSFNIFNPDPKSNPNNPVDLAYVYGRWVFDSLHAGEGWNELHPLHFMNKIGRITQGQLIAGGWPNLGDIKTKLDNMYETINDPTTLTTQAEPQNQWTLHPVLDGCMAGDGYPEPPPPQTTQ
jgi:hypothetical protein